MTRAIPAAGVERTLARWRSLCQWHERDQREMPIAFLCACLIDEGYVHMADFVSAVVKLFLDNGGTQSELLDAIGAAEEQ